MSLLGELVARIAPILVVFSMLLLQTVRLEKSRQREAALKITNEELHNKGCYMQLYTIEFKEKGDKSSQTALVVAESEQGAWRAFTTQIFNDLGYDVDKRTIKWAGPTVPLVRPDRVVAVRKIED